MCGSSLCFFKKMLILCVITCLAEGISAGRFVDLASALMRLVWVRNLMRLAS